MKHNVMNLDDPIIVNGYYLWYYTCDRDPTPSEPVVSSINLPSDPMWLQYWVNTVTNDVFMLMNYVADSLIWLKIAAPTNILNMIYGAGWNTNSPRTYSDQSSLGFNVSRQPNLTNDVSVVASINLVNTVGTTTTVTFQISADNTTWLKIATIANATGVASNIIESTSFTVPAGYYYQLASTGNGTILISNLVELIS